MLRRLAAVTAAFAFLMLAAPVGADHPQTVNGRTVAFDHRGGNEWWVEVFLGGANGGQATAVSATDDGATWVPLQKKSWGNWAGSFHIEVGNRVMFRATLSDGTQATSCWFTHPAGAEQCATQPTTSWNVQHMGSTGVDGADDIAIGDADNDGRNEAYVPTTNGIHQFSWTPNGWARTAIVLEGHRFDHVAIGDVNHDGRNELFATGMSLLYTIGYNGDEWGYSTLSIVGTMHIGGVTIGDVDDDGRREVYFGVLADDGPVYQVKVPGYGYPTTWTFISSLQGGTDSLWIGDADGNGDMELVVGSGNRGVDNVWAIDGGGNSWGTTLVDPARGGGMAGVVAGDGDRDGRGEVYTARIDPRTIHVSRWATGWTTTLAATLPSPLIDLALGDGDNDGSQELYATALNGHLYQVRWSGTAWVVRDLAAVSQNMAVALAVGDADNDGRREVYVNGYPGTSCCTNAGVYWVAPHAAPPRPPAPPPFWTMRILDYAGGGTQEDIAVGDVDGDGRNEVYVALRDGLVQLRWTGTAWSKTLVDTRAVERVVVADLDRDGRAEVYASTEPFTTLATVYQYKPSATGWQSVAVFTTGSDNPPIGSMTAGDVDDDGRVELYVMLDRDVFDEGTSTPVAVHMVWFDGAWRSRLLTSLAGGATSSWVGDGNRDGDLELYAAGTQKVWQVDGAGTAWGAQLIDEPSATFPGIQGYVYAVVVGDANNDGQSEVYVQHSDRIFRYAPNGSGGWTRTVVYDPVYGYLIDLTIGDADGDGKQELYVTNANGDVHQIRWTGSAWTAVQIQEVPEEAATDILVSDVDGDGARDLLVASTSYGRSPGYYLYELSAPQAARFDATFTAVRGNEWWVQASVAATGGTLAKVDVSLNGGAWQPMAKQSWGGWGASPRMVQGTIVQFRATSTTGATDLSDCYRWIPAPNTDATKVTCGSTPPPPPPPPPPGFDATFSGVKGNEWWVEAKVTGTQPIAKVDARVNCGAWKPLALKDWGAWAASFQVPAGSKVDFRATSSTGATDLSGGSVWPQATPTTGC